jgi:selenium metabolism protein YedF
VERFLGMQGFTVTIQGAEPEWAVIGKRLAPDQAPGPAEKDEAESPQKTLIFISRETLGRGDDALGTLLMLNFLRTLKELGKSLWRLVFVNGGVKLTIEGAETLPVLKELEGEGVSILVCGTCLNHFGLLEQKKCGQTTNMLDIVTSLQVADKVINL